MWTIIKETDERDNKSIITYIVSQLACDFNYLKYLFVQRRNIEAGIYLIDFLWTFKFKNIYVLTHRIEVIYDI